VFVLPLLTPECHRQQAQILVGLSDKTGDPDTAAALLELAASHVALAEQQSAQQPYEIQPQS
jgi:hypothetical protein